MMADRIKKMTVTCSVCGFSDKIRTSAKDREYLKNATAVLCPRNDCKPSQPSIRLMESMVGLSNMWSAHIPSAVYWEVEEKHESPEAAELERLYQENKKRQTLTGK